MNYFIADTHLGHKSIIGLSNRPFADVEEMDRTIIENWNNTVNKDDDIWILGDLCYKSSKKPQEYIDSLNGRLHLIIGNHDSFLLNQPYIRKRFDTIDQMRTINENGKRVILCHYPMAEWDGFFRGTVHLYGHIHNNIHNSTYSIMKDIDNAYNTGVDVIGFKPCTLEKVIVNNKRFNKLH